MRGCHGTTPKIWRCLTCWHRKYERGRKYFLTLAKVSRWQMTVFAVSGIENMNADQNIEYDGVFLCKSKVNSNYLKYKFLYSLPLMNLKNKPIWWVQPHCGTSKRVFPQEYTKFLINFYNCKGVRRNCQENQNCFSNFFHFFACLTSNINVIFPKQTFWGVKHKNPSSNKDFRATFGFWPSHSWALTTESQDTRSQ